MPVPKPKPNESQQEFISRCISEMHDIDPDRPHDQIIAICYTAWRDAKGESQDGTANIKAETLKEFLPKEFHRPLIYGATLQNPVNWNSTTSQPIIHIDTTTNDTPSVTYQFIPSIPKWTEPTPKKGESFRWMPEIKAELPEGARLYKVIALREGETYHIDWEGKRYTRHFSREEIARAARTLIGGYVNENHQFWKPFKDTWIIDAEEEDGNLECIIYSKNPEFHALYDSGKILGVSIEYDVRAEPVVNGYAQQGILLYGLAVITDPDDPPACKQTSISLLRSPEVTNQVKGESKMEKDQPKLDEVISRLTALEAEVKALAVKVSQLTLDDKQRAEKLLNFATELGFSDEKIEKLKELLVPTKPEKKEQEDEGERERLREQARERCAKYPVSFKEGKGHLTKPAEYENVPLDMFADPCNFKYPIDTEEHVRAALAYWNKPENREKGGYTEQEWTWIGNRIKKRAEALGIEVSEAGESPTKESEKSDSKQEPPKTESQKEPKTESENQTPKQEGMVSNPTESEEPEVPDYLKKRWEKLEKERELYV